MARFYLRFSVFLLGLFAGLYLGNKCTNNPVINSAKPSAPYFSPYLSWFQKKPFKRRPLSWDILRYSGNSYKLESEVLNKEIKVYCIILQRVPRNVDAALNTWAKGCSELKTIEINVRRNKLALKRSKENSSWVLLCETFKSISNESEWYLVVNDDTFVIMENLRYFLAPLNSQGMHYLGYAVKFWSTIYNSGQAGYALSRGALRALQSVIQKTGCVMNSFWNREDFYLGKQLAALNITPVDTRDFEGLSTFHAHNWYQEFFSRGADYTTSVFPVECCSKHSITFQAIEGDKMYTYYYLLYRLQVFLDGKFGNKIFSPQFDDDKVWRSFLKERNILPDNVSSQEYYKIWEELVDDPNSFAANMKKENFN